MLNNMRTATITRKTNETDVSLTLNLDGCSKSDVSTGVGFLDHMLTLFAAHGRFDLDVRCTGDVEVDGHHSVEDVGIALGEAVLKALGDKKGIVRYGSMLLPMDEALVLCAVDLSGRACLRYNAEIPAQKVGSFDTELTKEFFAAFTRKAELALHIIEAMFKAFGRALAQAVRVDKAHADEIPSTKGVLQ
jgi:imidazoleglycerol-phosphate dehydratase